MIRSTNNGLTNMFNVHTCATSSIYLIIAIISISHGKLVELSVDMVHCS
jgi:hypothetical protein